MESLGVLLPFIGFIILLIGVALAILGAVLVIAKRSSRKNKDGGEEGGESKGKLRGGGVVMVGPIPIIFGTDWKTILIALVAAIALIAIYILLLSS